MSEGDLQSAVIELCEFLGYRVFHCPDGVHNQRLNASAVGFPDLVIVGHGRVMYRELKSAKGKTTAAQRDWLQQLLLAGADTDVWYPRDWTSGAIAEQLGARKGA